MKYLSLSVLTVSLLASPVTFSRDKVVYGDDDRMDISEITDSALVSLAKSTAAMVPNSRLTLEEGEYTFRKKTLAEAMNVCSDERFADQLALADCSGFLVAPDIVVTAGHCVARAGSCEGNKWVFDFDQDAANLGKTTEDKVYNCKEVVSVGYQSIGQIDYAVVKLDRPVLDREPLKFRKAGKIEMGEGLFVVGHPSGLPTKVAGGTEVVGNDEDNFFTALLDTFGGNSGSAVFNSETLEVEGILVRGARDYVYDSEASCYRVNHCEGQSPLGCDGESVSRMSSVDFKDLEI